MSMNNVSAVAGVAVALVAAGMTMAGPAAAAGSTFRDCDQCPEMVVIPAGAFVMGAAADDDSREDDERPARTVTIARAFAMGKYEVTFDEWDACVAARACEKVADEGWGRGRRPVINIDQSQALAYTKWLSDKTGHTYALPTEAQWEYAAGAGTTRGTYWGAAKNQACAQGNVYDATAKSKLMFDWPAFPCEDGHTETAPVGSFAPNTNGLHDMLGNVWEWIADCYRPTYAGAPTDGSAVDADSCMKRMSKGGSWNIFPAWVRTTYRYGLEGKLRSNNLGMRVMRVMP
jgi:formylglycine-generating enzyme required for sulfatase activity